MAIYKNANLDISVSAEQNPNYNTKPSVQFSTQDKNTAKYTFTVKQNNKPVDLTGVTASVTLFSEDKSVFQSDATITSATEGKIEYVIPAEAIRHHGKTRGDLRLTYPNGDVLGGLRFTFNIEQALIDKAAGVVGGVYIRDFEQLKAEIEKTADSIKDIDVVRIDTKLNELEQKVEEGGVGVDEQARQKIEEVTTRLADTSNYTINDNQLSKRVTYDALSVKPTIYQAIITNPSGIAYTNKPIGIYVSFEKGQVVSDKRIKVTDSSGTEIPCQWEDDCHPRTYEGMGKWEDGSLKNGTVWIMSNLAANEQKTFNIQIVGADTSYPDTIPGGVITPGEIERLTANGIEFVINKSSSWGILDVKINGTDITGVNALQTTSIKNASYSDINSSQSGTTNILSKRINGNGVVFKEVVSRFSYVYEPNVVSTFRTRIWTNGDVDWETRTETVAALSAGVLNGIMEKIQWVTIPGATLDTHNHELYTGEIGQSQKMLAGYRWAQRHGESYDTNNYPIVVLNSAAKAYVGWQLGSPNTLAIPKGAYWTQSAYVSFNFDSVANERLRRINRLFTRATNENLRALKRKFNSYAKFYVENMRDWNLEKGENLFPGVNGLESLGVTNLSGDNLYNHAVDRFNNALTFYENGTKVGFVNAWKTTHWRRGIQYIGRDMSILPYLYDEAKKRNDKPLSDKILSTIHNLADAFVEIERLSGGNGKVALRGDGNMASTSDAMNPEATAIKHINLSLKYAENTTRRDCMNRIIARFNSTVEYNTRLPYAKIEIDTYYDTIINPRMHYHAFALFDYLQAVKNPPFDIRQLAFEVTNGTGQVKEIGYSYQQERRGLVSNAIYLACVLYKAGNISDLEQACKMLEYVIAHMYPNGGHIHPIDGWSNNDNAISGTPLESQALIETILSQ